MSWKIPTATLLLLAGACTRSSGETLRFSGASMGTTYTVEVPCVPAGVDVEALRAGADRVVQSIDERMSTFDPESELSRFNAAASTDWFPVSADTRTVVAAALRVGRLSGGAFDVTIGPLAELWGFGAAQPPDAVPAEGDIAAARRRVGHGLLETRSSPPALRKLVPDLEVDLSGLAKGFAVDAVARYLEDAGVSRYLVEIGGELRACGLNAAGEPWRVGIEEPSDAGTSILRVVGLRERAIATSGDYRNFYELDGRRYSHVIDPRTGRPGEQGVASATVLAETAIVADAFATALMVLAPEEGLDLAERLGLSVHLIVRANDGFVELSSPGFEREVLH